MARYTPSCPNIADLSTIHSSQKSKHQLKKQSREARVIMVVCCPMLQCIPQFSYVCVFLFVEQKAETIPTFKKSCSGAQSCQDSARDFPLSIGTKCQYGPEHRVIRSSAALASCAPSNDGIFAKISIAGSVRHQAVVVHHPRDIVSCPQWQKPRMMFAVYNTAPPDSLPCLIAARWLFMNPRKSVLRTSVNPRIYNKNGKLSQAPGEVLR